MGRDGPNRSELWEKRDYSIAGNRVEVTVHTVLILTGTNTGEDGHLISCVAGGYFRTSNVSTFQSFKVSEFQGFRVSSFKFQSSKNPVKKTLKLETFETLKLRLCVTLSPCLVRSLIKPSRMRKRTRAAIPRLRGRGMLL